MTIKPITEQVLYLERHQIEKLQEQEEVVTFAALQSEEELSFRVYPEAIMRIATSALISCNQKAKGEDFEVSQALARLRLAGVPIVC